MSSDYLNLINTNKTDWNFGRPIESELHESETYKDVLKRIQGMMEKEKQTIVLAKSKQSQELQGKESGTSSFTIELEKNHCALKKMIEMIDNRETTRNGDSLFLGKSRPVQRVNRFMDRALEKSAGYNKSKNNKDLQEIKGHLGQVMELIERKIKENQRDDEGGQYKDHKTDLHQIKNKLQPNLYKINLVHGKAQKTVEETSIDKHRIGTAAQTFKIGPPTISPFLKAQQVVSHELLQSRPSFDRVHQVHSRYESSMKSSNLQKNHVHQQTPRLAEVSSPAGDKVKQRREVYSQSKQFNTYPSENELQKEKFSPRINFVHNQNVATPIAVRPMSVDNRLQANISPTSNRVYLPINSSNISSQYPQNQVQHHTQSYYPYSVSIQSNNIPVNIVPSYSNYPAMASVNQNQYLYQFQKKEEGMLKKSAKQKPKFSFKQFLHGNQEAQPNYSFIAETETDKSVGVKQQSFINFPDPFTPQENSMQSPFINWKDDRQDKVKEDSKFSNNKSSLKSIPEASEDSAKFSFIQKVSDFQNSRFPSQKGFPKAFGESSFSISSGDGRLKKKGIGLYQPTYKTQYYPQK